MEGLNPKVKTLYESEDLAKEVIKQIYDEGKQLYRDDIGTGLGERSTDLETKKVFKENGPLVEAAERKVFEKNEKEFLQLSKENQEVVNIFLSNEEEYYKKALHAIDLKKQFPQNKKQIEEALVEIGNLEEENKRLKVLIKNVDEINNYFSSVSENALNLSPKNPSLN